MRLWLALCLVLWCGAAAAAGAPVVVPLSRPGLVSLSLVCQADGIVGPYVDTSRANRATSGLITLFTRSDFARRAAYFDVPPTTPAGLLALPEHWIHIGGGGPAGFFITAGDFSVPDRTAALRALAVRTQLLLLQVATSRFVGVETADQRFVIEVDPSALTQEALSTCLSHAGLPVARAAFDPAHAPMPSRSELTSLCLTLFNRAESLAALLESLPTADQARLARTVAHPVHEQVECFLPSSLDARAILAAAHEASAIAAFDYLGVARAATAVTLPPEAYEVLKTAWGAQDLPGQREAEAEVERAAKATAMRKAYFQFSRVLACVDSLKQSRLEPIAPPRLVSFRSDLSHAERGLRDEIDLDVLWMDSMRDYQKMLASLRMAVQSNPTSTMDLCAYEAAKMDAILARMNGGTDRMPVRDFGTARISKADLP